MAFKLIAITKNLIFFSKNIFSQFSDMKLTLRWNCTIVETDFQNNNFENIQNINYQKNST